MGLLKDCAELFLTACRAVRDRPLSSASQAVASWARAWTVDEWLEPWPAVMKFGDRCWLQRRGDAYNHSQQKHKEMLPLFKTMPLEYEKQYQALHQETERETEAIMGILFEDLRGKLLRGELIARGFREPFSHGAPYLIISRDEWRLLEVKPGDRSASGGGITYEGVTIGKPGTKRFFQRRCG